MVRILSIMGLTLVCGSSALGVTSHSLLQRRVWFARLPKNAPERLRTLDKEIVAFQKDMQHLLGFTFVDKDSKADYRYIDFAINKTTESRLRLVANVWDRKPLGQIYSDPIPDGTDSVHRLFYDLIDKTLFDQNRGVYRPLRIEACSMVRVVPAQVRIAVTPDPGNAPLDPFVSYRWGDWNASHTGVETACIELGSAQPDAGAPDTSATFDVEGPSRSLDKFMTQCKIKKCSGFLVPQMRPCVEQGTLNANTPNPR
jgi:hypothetical protein